MSDDVCWGLHAGRSAEAEQLLRQRDRIGIGWPQMGDLSELAPTRDVFKAHLREVFPNEKEGAIPVKAGMLYRFVHEMEPDNIVLYPSKVAKTVPIGLIKYRSPAGRSSFGPSNVPSRCYSRQLDRFCVTPQVKYSKKGQPDE